MAKELFRGVMVGKMQKEDEEEEGKNATFGIGNENIVTLEEFMSIYNSKIFFKEFTFSKNTFKSNDNNELELADGIILLGDNIIIQQMKQRNLSHVVDKDSEEKWFNKKVIKKAKTQIKDTLKFIASENKIEVKNGRNHTFDLSKKSNLNITKIIIHFPSQKLPRKLANTKHNVSKEAGFIHIFNSLDYTNVLNTLQIPSDIIDYLNYRESVIKRWTDIISEPLIMNQYLSGNLDKKPEDYSLIFLRNLNQSDEGTDFTTFLSKIAETIECSEQPYDYYEIMQEFIKLSRSHLRMFNQRFRLCLEKTKNKEFTRPYRMTVPDIKCGFVLLPMPPEWTKEFAEDQNLHGNALKNITLLHKYEQKIDKCIGVSVLYHERDFIIFWCLAEYSWLYDPIMEEELKNNFPFRDVQGKTIERFIFE